MAGVPVPYLSTPQALRNSRSKLAHLVFESRPNGWSPYEALLRTRDPAGNAIATPVVRVDYPVHFDVPKNVSMPK